MWKIPIAADSLRERLELSGQQVESRMAEAGDVFGVALPGGRLVPFVSE